MLKIPALTGLRFFAAFFILLGHGLPKLMSTGSNDALWYVWPEGMPLFFVLSGFVIHYNYANQIQERDGVGIYNFLVARFARLYPLFLLGMIYDLVHHFGYATLTASFKQAIPYYLTLTQAWFYIIMGKNSLIFQFGLIPQVTWSISAEWFFYLLYPCLCFFLIKITGIRAKVAAIFITCLLFSCVMALLVLKSANINHFAISLFGSMAASKNNFQNSFFLWLVYLSPYSHIAEFIIGCLTASIYMKISHLSLSKYEEYAGLALLICLLVGLAIFHYLFFSMRTYQFIWMSGFAPLFASIIFCCARYANFLSRFLSCPALMIGGEASYSIYLFHMIIIEAFSRDAAIITSWQIFLADAVRCIFAFAAILGMSIFSYKIVEVPARKFLRNILSIKNNIPVRNDLREYEA